jgi:hypothetical protein
MRLDNPRRHRLARSNRTLHAQCEVALAEYHPTLLEQNLVRATKRRTVGKDIDGGITLIVGDGEFRRPWLGCQSTQRSFRTKFQDRRSSHQRN